MRLLRRLTAAFVTVLLLQLTLLGSGTLCDMQDGRAMAGAGAMAGHAMDAMSSMPGMHDAPAPAGPRAPEDCGGAGGGSRDDCRLPWSSGQCTSMTSCAAIVVPVAAIAAQPVTARVALRIAEPARIHSGPALAPELPPPRA